MVPPPLYIATPLVWVMFHSHTHLCEGIFKVIPRCWLRVLNLEPYGSYETL